MNILDLWEYEYHEEACSLLESSLMLDFEIYERFPIEEGIGEIFENIKEKFVSYIKSFIEWLKDMKEKIKDMFDSFRGKSQEVKKKLTEAHPSNPEEEARKKVYEQIDKLVDGTTIPGTDKKGLYTFDISKTTDIINKQDKIMNDIFTFAKNSWWVNSKNFENNMESCISKIQPLNDELKQLCDKNYISNQTIKPIDRNEFTVSVTSYQDFLNRRSKIDKTLDDVRSLLEKHIDQLEDNLKNIIGAADDALSRLKDSENSTEIRSKYNTILREITRSVTNQKLALRSLITECSSEQYAMALIDNIWFTAFMKESIETDDYDGLERITVARSDVKDVEDFKKKLTSDNYTFKIGK